jgi:hypothetical protein
MSTERLLYRVFCLEGALSERPPLLSNSLVEVDVHSKYGVHAASRSLFPRRLCAAFESRSPSTHLVLSIILTSVILSICTSLPCIMPTCSENSIMQHTLWERTHRVDCKLHSELSLRPTPFIPRTSLRLFAMAKGSSIP